MKKDKVLIVDDEELNRLLLEGMLEVLGYDSCSAADGAEALRMLNEEIDLVLLDVNMPELTGFDVVRKIRKSETCSDVPVVMITALSSMQDRLAAVEAGSNDFISKPVDLTELHIRAAAQLRVKHAQDEVKRHRCDLEVQVKERTFELEAANEKLSKLATTDAGTGLANHRCLVNLLDEIITQSTDGNVPCSLLFLDLDHFKALNDSCGHAAGDAVLSELGGILEKATGQLGVCGRWGGEEFVCILPGVDEMAAVELAEKIRGLVACHAFPVGTGSHVTCSIGVATFPSDGDDRASLAEAADRAMYVAKALGRNQVRAASRVADGFDALKSDSSAREDAALSGLVEALATLVNMRDRDSGSHINDVEALSKRLAEKIGLSASDVRLIGIAGKLHDIGKVAISDAILTKCGALTPTEWDIVRQHPVIGAEVVARVPTLRAIASAIRSHHEWWDGRGYPDGLVGAAIPIGAQIIAVADAYSAMTTNRPYRNPKTHREAMAELEQCAGSQFSPDVVRDFSDVMSAEICVRAA